MDQTQTMQAESDSASWTNLTDFHEGSARTEALARLDYLVSQRRRFGMLLGDHGSGKTSLFATFAQRIRRGGGSAAQLNVTGLDGEEFPWLVAERLGARPRRDSSPADLWRRIADKLTESWYQQSPVVVLLDDMSPGGSRLHDAILRLVHLDAQRPVPLTVVFSIRTQQMELMPRRLLDLVDLRIELYGWDYSDTEAYVSTALANAGESTTAFSSAALQRLHELGGGVPRRVHQLMELTLLASTGSDLNEIDALTIDTVHDELMVAAD